MPDETNYTRATELTPEIVAQLHDVFTYHPWDAEQKQKGDQVVQALISAVKVIIFHVPPCATRTRAINKLIDARMLANAAITHKGLY